MEPRTPGRRKAEIMRHLHFKLVYSVVLALVASSVWFTLGRVKELQKLAIHNPHYEVNHCFDCHEDNGSKMTATGCFECHDMFTRELRSGAVAKRKKLTSVPCDHPIQRVENDGFAGRTPTQLCLKCHSGAKPYVAMLNFSTGEYVEIDIGRLHPIGLKPTESIYPKTLPLGKRTGTITCITCHDQHGLDPRMKLMRLYHPGNGRPADYRPLCLDCHEQGWLPIGAAIVKEFHKD